MKIYLISFISFVLIAALTTIFNTKQEKTQITGDIKLLPPETTGGMPIMEALQKRHSSRNFSDKMISDQELSNLLWSAFGINRKDSGKRTAPTARDTRAMDIYVSLKTGLYLYQAETHTLKIINQNDIRSLTGMQEFAGIAPVNLIYVSDYSKFEAEQTIKDIYSGSHAGFIGENVYLYCTSANLATVIRASFDKEKLSNELGLEPNKKVILVQTVGYEG